MCIPSFYIKSDMNKARRDKLKVEGRGSGTEEVAGVYIFSTLKKKNVQEGK